MCSLTLKITHYHMIEKLALRIAAFFATRLPQRVSRGAGGQVCRASYRRSTPKAA
jgi:hypothetical protein